MTAAVHGPRFRDQLAEWLREHTGAPDGDSWDDWPLHLQRTAAHLAAHVQAEVQAATNQRAAEAERALRYLAGIVQAVGFPGYTVDAVIHEAYHGSALAQSGEQEQGR